MNNFQSKIIENDISAKNSFQLFKLWKHIKIRRKIQLFFILFVMIMSGLAEVISLASILPFVIVLTEPNKLNDLPFLGTIIKNLNIDSSNELLFLVTFIFCIAVCSSAFIRISNLWLNNRISASIGTELTDKLYRIILNEPYSVHLQRNSSDVINTIFNNGWVTADSINFALQLLTALIVATSLIFTVFWINYILAVSAFSVFAIAYVIIGLTFRKKLIKNSELIVFNTNKLLKTIQEGLGAIRDILLSGNQQLYIDYHRQSEYLVRRSLAQSQFLGASPRYILETIGLISMAIFSLILAVQNKTEKNILPLIGTIALAAQRLLPAMQQIYSNWASIKGSSKAISNVLDVLNKESILINEKYYDKISKIKLRNNIEFSNLSFKFPNTKKNILKDINLKIEKGDLIGIIGKTGSGKSTLMDLMMGLHQPHKGKLLIDGESITLDNERIICWRKSISHVPQTIYLSDSSILENIAFGEFKEKINIAKVKDCAKRAKISSFIESLPMGYDSKIGERGVRISGGQRQRIGIARALYKDSKILFLDEATSALDEKTEKEVVDSIQNFDKELTIIMIAHRLKTVSKCNKIISIENGRIQAFGSPKDVLNQRK